MRVELGALEVYFMGVRLFSKISSGTWPHTSLLAEKCVNAYNDFMSNKDISIYETTVAIRRSQNMLGGSNQRNAYDTASEYQTVSGGFYGGGYGGGSEVLEQLAQLDKEEQM